MRRGLRLECVETKQDAYISQYITLEFTLQKTMKAYSYIQNIMGEFTEILAFNLPGVDPTQNKQYVKSTLARSKIRDEIQRKVKSVKVCLSHVRLVLPHEL